MLPLEWIWQQFSCCSMITDQDLRTLDDDRAAQQAALVLNYLVAQGIVSAALARGQRIFTIQDLDALRQVLDSRSTGPTSTPPAPETATVSPSDSESLPEKLVVSVPLSMTSKLQALQRKHCHLHIEDMKTIFSGLLAGAQHEVLLSVPFLELDGLMVFVDEIRELGSRQVAVKALTRELRIPSRHDYGYSQKLRACSKLVDLYLSGGGKPEAIEIRDYTVRIGGASDRALLYEGIHQKMIVADRTRSYIGSGEIRAATLLMNGDVGVFHSGQIAEFWADYFLLFWNEAQIVDQDFLLSAQ